MYCAPWAITKARHSVSAMVLPPATPDGIITAHPMGSTMCSKMFMATTPSSRKGRGLQLGVES